MKSIKWSYFTIAILLFITLPAFADDNVVHLETDSDKLNVKSPLLQSFVDYYQGDLNNDKEKNSSLLYILSQDGYKPKNSKRVTSVKLGMFYGGDYQLTVPENHGDVTSKYNIPLAEPYFILNLNENKDIITLRYNFGKTVPDNYNKFTSRITQFSYVHNFNQNQAISVGEDVRVPIGVNGSESTWTLDTVLRAQISRTYSNTYAVGVRNLGKYKYLDYDMGVYDSSRFLHNFFNGGEFIGLATFKPFANLDNEKFGTLKIGGSVDQGHNKINYGVYGVHASYDYGRFHSKFEYAYADGYNSIKPVNTKSEGFFTSASFDLTNKLQIIGKYDYINQNKHLANEGSKEYTIGITYTPKERFKILLNYMYRDNKYNQNSNNILLATRILI